MQSIVDIIIKWCIKENKSPETASLMITEYNKDAEFWCDASLWILFDTVSEL